MPPIETVRARPHELGPGFSILRVLPSPGRRSLGPFVFLDHFGPIVVDAQRRIDVRPHPHIGLATVTYLYEGAMMHRDSLGFEARIEPGAINWMHAGRGIVHSERKPPDLAQATFRLHGLQSWLALPAASEDSAPSFQHTPASAIPVLEREGTRVAVLVGTAFGVASPVSTASRTVYLAAERLVDGSLAIPPLERELGAYVTVGAARIDGTEVPAGVLAVLPAGRTVSLEAPAGTRFVLIGGDPLDAERFLWWNFVSSSRQRIVQAAADWDAGRFDPVPGETERIPLPDKPPPWVATGGESR